MGAADTYLPTWSEAEIDLFVKREAVFIRRGAPADKAEQLAERLVQRDRDGDDRRICLECSGLREDGGCTPAKQGLIPGASPRLTPVTDQLQRCRHFGPRIT